MSDWIYVTDKENEHRYLLGQKGEKILLCIGINPSTAQPETVGKLDPTAKKVRKIASANGCCGWVMINVYPEIKTCFNELSLRANDEIHKENLRNIEKLINEYDEIKVWVAFGNHIYHRKYFKQYLRDLYELIQTKNPSWFSVGVNKSGAPAHPLYKKGDSFLTEFKMKDFVETFCGDGSDK